MLVNTFSAIIALSDMGSISGIASVIDPSSRDGKPYEDKTNVFVPCMRQSNQLIFCMVHCCRHSEQTSVDRPHKYNTPQSTIDGCKSAAAIAPHVISHGLWSWSTWVWSTHISAPEAQSALSYTLASDNHSHTCELAISRLSAIEAHVRNLTMQSSHLFCLCSTIFPPVVVNATLLKKISGMIALYQEFNGVFQIRMSILMRIELWHNKAFYLDFKAGGQRVGALAEDPRLVSLWSWQMNSAFQNCTNVKRQYRHVYMRSSLSKSSFVTIALSVRRLFLLKKESRQVVQTNLGDLDKLLAEMKDLDTSCAAHPPRGAVRFVLQTSLIFDLNTNPAVT